jgi:competence protein ComFC
MSLTALTRSAKKWVDAGISLVYPNTCQICHAEEATPAEGFIGAACRGAVKLIEPPFCHRCGLPYSGEITTEFVCSNCAEIELSFEWARAAVAAKSVVMEVIHRYKYNRALWFEPFLAGLLIRQAVPTIQKSEWDLIVPVPLHSLKKREREFNQAERLAKYLSAATGIPIETKLLARVEATETQTRLTRSQRAGNVGSAFAFRGSNPVKGKRIILLDDVLTTGATTSACAKVLRQNGSGPVAVWTVARGL